MFTAQESDIVDNAIAITRQMIDEFRNVEGCIGIVGMSALSGYQIERSILEMAFPSTAPSFRHCALSVTGEVFQGIQYNLIIKTTKLASLHA